MLQKQTNSKSLWLVVVSFCSMLILSLWAGGELCSLVTQGAWLMEQTLSQTLHTTVTEGESLGGSSSCKCVYFQTQLIIRIRHMPQPTTGNRKYDPTACLGGKEWKYLVNSINDFHTLHVALLIFIINQFSSLLIPKNQSFPVLTKLDLWTG